MSSFSTQFQYEIFAFFIANFILFIIWRRWLRYWHIGFGTELALKTSDGSIFVASRLLNYPAHAHCIPNRALVVSIDGTPMQFKSDEEFSAWFKAYAPKRGVASKWIVRTGEGEEILAAMRPVLVMSKIPVYWSPNFTRPWIPDKHRKLGTMMAYCSKTGQYHHRQSRFVKDWAVVDIVL